MKPYDEPFYYTFLMHRLGKLSVKNIKPKDLSDLTQVTIRGIKNSLIETGR